MSSPEPHPLGYAQQNYHYRQPAWEALAGVGVIVAIFAETIGLTHSLGTVPGIALIVAVLVLIGSALYSTRIALLGGWECRVEGTSLSFHRPGDQGWVVMEIAEIKQVNNLFTDSEQRTDYELVLRDGSRALLDCRLIGSFKQFKQALRAANPKVTFGRRNMQECHACGADMRIRRDRRPSCATPIPAPIPFAK